MWELAIDRLDEILTAFNVETVEYPNRYTGICPIHVGDNRTAFSIYKSNGYWRCFTLGCHEKWGDNLAGLIRALLSKNENKEVSYQEAIDFLQKMFGGNFKGIIPNINNAFLIKHKTNHSTITRDKARSKLDIPAQYFIDRGFSLEILDRYDVGYCSNKKSRFFDRCVAPIYDIDYKFMIGCTGRDPSNKKPQKWLHSEGLNRDGLLYNSWFAKQYIQKNNTALIVESPGNIWKLEEAGIHCGLAILGTELSFGQMRLLAQLGVLNLVIILDNDDAGKLGASRIVKKLKGLYNIIVPKIDYGDIAECPKDYLESQILPILKEL